GVEGAGFAEVQGQCHGGAALFLDGGDRVQAALGVAAVGQDDADAAPGDLQGGAAADAGARAGDDGDLHGGPPVNGAWVVPLWGVMSRVRALLEQSRQPAGTGTPGVGGDPGVGEQHVEPVEAAGPDVEVGAAARGPDAACVGDVLVAEDLGG